MNHASRTAGSAFHMNWTRMGHSVSGFLVLVVAVIILTWGSIASAALTLGLILGFIFLALKKSLNRDVDDYFMEE